MNRVIKSFEKLPSDVKLAFKIHYQGGVEDSITRITKPDNSSIFVVPFETEDTYYLVKMSSLVNADDEVIIEDDFLDDSIEVELPDDEDEVTH
jgi:hypothetical protein